MVINLRLLFDIHRNIEINSVAELFAKAVFQRRSFLKPNANNISEIYLEFKMNKPKLTVLVLCTGNSCRSQMAEAIINNKLADKVRGISAGTMPQPKVADGALQALQMIGLPTDGLFPKGIEAIINEPIDLIVTVCDNAKESCPIFPKPVPCIHLPFHDPHGEPLESFVTVRDDIEKHLIPAVREALGL
jgi:arsenate reductase